MHTNTAVRRISANMAVDALIPIETVFAPMKEVTKPEVTVREQYAPTIAPKH